MADGALRLSPRHAIAYLAELSIDLRAALVLDPRDGALRAGPEALAEPARALLAAAAGAPLAEAEVPGGRVMAACGARHALVLVLGAAALPGLARFDALRVLGDLEGAAPPDAGAVAGAPDRAVIAAATALADATRP